jgi:hypothetical protein
MNKEAILYPFNSRFHPTHDGTPRTLPIRELKQI